MGMSIYTHKSMITTHKTIQYWRWRHAYRAYYPITDGSSTLSSTLSIMVSRLNILLTVPRRWFFWGSFLCSRHDNGWGIKCYSDASRQSHHLFYRWTVNDLTYTATGATYERSGNERYETTVNSIFTSYFRSVQFRFIPFKTRTSYKSLII